MTFKFSLFSQEKEDFVVEILMDAEASFSELRQLILQHCGYPTAPGQIFLICDEDWRVTQRIRPEDDGTLSSEEDLLLMDECTLRDFMEDEGQHLAFVYNKAQHGMFLIELSEITFGNPTKEARVTRSHGTAPSWNALTENTESAMTESKDASDTESEDFTADSFDAEELDMEGFEIEDN